MNTRRAVVFTMVEILIALVVIGLLLIALYAVRQNAPSRMSLDSLGIPGLLTPHSGLKAGVHSTVFCLPLPHRYAEAVLTEGGLDVDGSAWKW
jgi:prepilin-type N-terminal cleavage/methylation domain-containing protein